MTILILEKYALEKNYCHGDMDMNAFICGNRVVLHHHAIVYKKSKFSVLSIDGKMCELDERRYTDGHKPDILKKFEEKLKYNDDDPLKKRACVAILECIGNDCSSTWHPRVIVVSFHNPYKQTGQTGRTNNVLHFFNALHYLGQMTGYPVLVGGDFNCKLPMYYNSFTILHYNPTIWRAGKDCIDYFAYKNYSKSTKIVVNDVSASLVLPLDYCPMRGTNDSILKQIGTMSDHDPVRATMTVRFLPPTLGMPQTLSISCCNMNSVQNAADYLAKRHYTSDLIVLYNTDELELHLSGYQENTFKKTRLYCKQYYLWCCSCKEVKPTESIPNRVKIIVFNLEVIITDDGSNLKVALAFIDNQGVDQLNSESFKDLFQHIEANISTDLLIVMGNFNKPADLPNVAIKQCDLPSDGSQDDRNLFFAYKNIPREHDAVIKFTSLTVHSTATTIHKINKDNVITNTTQIPTHQALLKFKFLKFCINVLHFNMADTNKSHISSYFINLNPKPDLFIFQESQGIKIDELLYKKCCGSNIVYNSELFQLVSEIEFNLPAHSMLTITACIIKCLRIVGNPEIIVASFNNCTRDTDNVTRCFNILKNDQFPYPVLIAGGFNVPQRNFQPNNDYIVPTCYPTMLRALACGPQNDHSTFLRKSFEQQNNYFAHKSSARTIIELKEVCAETVVPHEDLVTGADKYNAYCNKETLNMIKHDPIRAKMIIKSASKKVTSTSTPSSTQSKEVMSTSTPSSTPSKKATSTSTPSSTPSKKATSTSTPSSTPSKKATSTSTPSSTPSSTSLKQPNNQTPHNSIKIEKTRKQLSQPLCDT